MFHTMKIPNEKKNTGKTIIPLNAGKRNRIDRDKNGAKFCAMHEKTFFSVLKIRHARARTNTIASQNKHICTIGEPERELDLVEIHGRVPFSFNCTTTTTTQSRMKKTVSLMWRSLENVCAPVYWIIGTQDTLYCMYIYLFIFFRFAFVLQVDLVWWCCYCC